MELRQLLANGVVRGAAVLVFACLFVIGVQGVSSSLTETSRPAFLAALLGVFSLLGVGFVWARLTSLRQDLLDTMRRDEVDDTHHLWQLDLPGFEKPLAEGGKWRPEKYVGLTSEGIYRIYTGKKGQHTYFSKLTLDDITEFARESKKEEAEEKW